MSRFKLFMMQKVAQPKLAGLKETEKNAMNYPDHVLPNEHSFERFDIPGNLMKRNIDKNRFDVPLKIMRHIIGSALGIQRSLTDIRKNPTSPRTEITAEELQEMEKYAKAMGVSSIGYTTLDPVHVFRDKAVLHNNVIVLTMEMVADKIAKAPSVDTFGEIHLKYYSLGKASNKLAKWLRNKGFSVQAVPPLNGVILFPPLAEKAGLGYHGIHGLIITPEHGPRVRLCAVTTSITNLPVNETTNHEWIGDYCTKCQICVKKCPVDAISVEPVVHPGGLMTHVDENKCFPEFADNYGCTVCIAVCPFSVNEFHHLLDVVNKKQVEEVISQD